MSSMAPSLDTGMRRGLVVFRWFALAWAWVGLAIERSHLTDTVTAVALLLLASAVTAAASIGGAWWREAGSTAAWLEVGVAVLLLIGDGLVYDVDRAQSLPWAWPAAGIIAVAIALSIDDV